MTTSADVVVSIETTIDDCCGSGVNAAVVSNTCGVSVSDPTGFAGAGAMVVDGGVVVSGVTMGAGLLSGEAAGAGGAAAGASNQCGREPGPGRPSQPRPPKPPHCCRFVGAV